MERQMTLPRQTPHASIQDTNKEPWFGEPGEEFKPHLSIKFRQGSLKISPKGAWSPEKLVRYLPGLLGCQGDHERLEFDLSHWTGLDQPGLAFLCMVLSETPHKYCELHFKGLAEWATRRLAREDPAIIFGPSWEANIDRDLVRLSRRA